AYQQAGERSGGESACTPDSVRRFRGTVVAAIPLRPRLPARPRGPPRGGFGPALLPPRGPSPRGGLPPAPVAPRPRARFTPPFPPYLYGAAPETGPAIGGLFSVALSCGSPRLGVTQHRVLRSPDVPRTGAPKRPARGRPAGSPPSPLSRSGGSTAAGIVVCPS